MKKTNLLSILAVSSLMVTAFAMAGKKQYQAANAAGIDELAPWGECEEDLNDAITGASFIASDEEKLLGEKSFKLTATDQQIRLNISPNGSIYEGSAYFKGTAGSTVTLIGVLPYQSNGAWLTGYFDGWAPITLTGGWDEFQFAFSCKQEGEEILMDKNGDGQFEDVAKLAGTFGAVNMLFRFSAGPVYMDHFNYHIKADVPAGSLLGEGGAEKTGLGESWQCYARSYEDSYKGGHSYKAANGNRSRFTMPLTDGTLYEGTLKVKGEADTTFKLTGIFTCQDTSSNWTYGYLDAFAPITLTGGWDEFNFKFSVLFDGDTHLLSIRRTGAEMVAGDPTLENIAVAAALDMQVDTTSAAVYMDEFYVVAKQEEQPEIDYSDAVVYYSFDDSIAPFAFDGVSGYAVHTTEEGEVYRGAGALKLKDVWTRHTDSACTWIQEGDFLEFSAYVKNLATAPTSAAYVQLQTWSCNGENPAEGWAVTNTRIDLIHYNNGATSDSFRLLKGKFGIYGDGNESFIYHNGQLINAEFPAGNVVAPQIMFDLGATAPDALAFDDVAIMKTTVKKDAILTLTGLNDPAIKVFKGTEEITDVTTTSEGNRITFKNLEYGNFKDKYTLKIYDSGNLVGEREVSFAHNEVSYSPAYTATLTVKDVNNQPITDAVISYQGGQVTENDNGVYTIANIEGDLAVTISKDGYITANIVVSVNNNEVNVTLREPQPVKEYEDNLFPKNANIEDGWTYVPNKQGLDYVVTDEEQCEGSKSLKLTATNANGRSLFRIQDAPNYSGKTYRLEAMVKAQTTAHFTLGALFTCQSRSGWAYGTAVPAAIEVTNEWQLVAMTFKYEFDSLAGTLSVSVNGEEPVVTNEIVSVAAYDFVLQAGEENEVLYVDDLAMYELFDAKVNVIGQDGNPAKNATFALTDPRGKTTTPNISYNEEQGCYLFQGLYGAQSLVATANEKTFGAVKVTKAIAASNINIEDTYSITLTLKDQNNNPVTGATVIARKGITTVGTFTEVGNGVYKLDGVMGEVTVVITKDGYDFERQTVNASNATLTVTGTNNNQPDPEPDEPKPAKKGCGGSLVATSVIISSLALAGAGLLVFKKKKQD